MKQEQILIYLLLLIAAACKQDEINSENNFRQPYAISGFVQKGPFINGTLITLSELDENLNQSGVSYSSQISNNTGDFEFNDLELESPFILLRASGFYFDEVKGSNSSAQLTLFAISNISGRETANVNILSHLERERVEFLVETDLEFNEAKDSAQYELLLSFGINNQNIVNSEELNISFNSIDNAILLAISIILQGDNSVADLTQLLANISSDFKEDGVIDDEAILSQLYNNAKRLDLELIRSNLENRYRELGLEVIIPDFESIVEQYLLTQAPSGTYYLAQSFGEFGGESGNFRFPENIMCDSDGNYYVSDNGNHHVLKFSPDGVFLENYYSCRNARAFHIISDNRRLAECDGYYVRILDDNNNIIREWGGRGTRDGEFGSLSDVAIDDNMVFVVDLGNYRIQKFDIHGNFILKWDWQFEYYPWGITIFKNMVAVSAGTEIHFFTKEGSFIRSWRFQQNTIRGLETDGEYLYAASGSVLKLNESGQIVNNIGGENGSRGATDVTLNQNGDVVIIDTYERQVRVYRKKD